MAERREPGPRSPRRKTFGPKDTDAPPPPRAFSAAVRVGRTVIIITFLQQPRAAQLHAVRPPLASPRRRLVRGHRLWKPVFSGCIEDIFFFFSHLFHPVISLPSSTTEENKRAGYDGPRAAARLRGPIRISEGGEGGNLQRRRKTTNTRLYTKHILHHTRFFDLFRTKRLKCVR